MDLHGLPAELTQELASYLNVAEILTLCQDAEISPKLCDGPFLRRLAREYLTSDADYTEEETSELLSDLHHLVKLEQRFAPTIEIVDDFVYTEVPFRYFRYGPTRILPSASIDHLYKLSYRATGGGYFRLQDEALAKEKEITTAISEYIDFLIDRGYEKRLFNFLRYIGNNTRHLLINRAAIGGDIPSSYDYLYAYHAEIDDDNREKVASIIAGTIFSLTPGQYAAYIATCYQDDDLVEQLLDFLSGYENGMNIIPVDPDPGDKHFDAEDYPVDLEYFLSLVGEQCY